MCPRASPLLPEWLTRLKISRIDINTSTRRTLVGTNKGKYGVHGEREGEVTVDEVLRRRESRRNDLRDPFYFTMESDRKANLAETS